MSKKPQTITDEERIKKNKELFGDGIVKTFTDKSEHFKRFDLISSGSIYLDESLGGGFPKGTVVELLGWQMTGKTSLCLHVIKEAQKQFPDERVLFVDMEHRLDVQYGRSIGVDFDKLIYATPRHAEQAIELMEKNIRWGNISVCVLDSIAAMIPKKRIEEGKREMGDMARIWGDGIAQLDLLLPVAKTLLLCTNQFRVTNMSGYGSPYGGAGGNATKYFASIRIELKVKGFITDSNDQKIGQITEFEIVKNSFSQPYRKNRLHIIFGKGISKEEEIFDIAILMGEIEKNGSWYKYKGENIAQGRLRAVEVLGKSGLSDLENKAKKFIANG